MSENINKIWGTRRRILLTDNSEIDLLYLKKDSFCSLHRHKQKINKFVVIFGKVKIETEFGQQVLKKNDSFTVKPPQLHRFIAIEDSIMVELAYTPKNIKINETDILRISQGGLIINGIEMAEDELRKKGMLEL